MGFFSFLKKKKEPPYEKGAEPLKLDINLPPVEPVRPHPFAPETPEVTPQQEIPPLSMPREERPEAFREADSYRGELATRDLSKSLDLLSAKLDSIRLMIENLNHRLDKIETEKKKEAIKW